MEAPQIERERKLKQLSTARSPKRSDRFAFATGLFVEVTQKALQQNPNFLMEIWDDCPLHPEVLQDFKDGKRGPL